MKKLSVLLIIQGIFCFISAILLFVAAAKIKAMTNGYYEPGFELTLYILIALELIVIGIVNFVVAIAIDNDANKLEKVCNDVKNMQQQSNNTTWSGVGFKPTNTNCQSVNRTQSKPKVANSLQNCPICLHPLVDNKCSNCGFKG